MLDKFLFSEIQKRQLSSAWGNLFLLGTAAFADFNFTKAHILDWFGLILFLHIIVNLWRGVSSFGYNQRWIYFGITLLSSASWLGMGLYVFQVKSLLDPQSIVFIIILAGAAASSATTLAGNYILSSLNIALTTLIPGTYLLFVRDGKFLGAVSYAFFLYLILHIRSHQSFLKGYYQNKEQLQSERDFVRGAIDAIPGLLSVLSRELKYELVNQHLVRTLKMEESQFIGQDVGFLAKKEGDKESDFEQRVKDFSRRALTETAFRAEVSLGSKSAWYSIHLSRIKNTGQILVLALDIDEQVRLEVENLAQKKQFEASERMAALGLISAGISHEINNPLAILIGKLGILKKRLGQEPPPTREFWLENIGKMEKTAERISRIVKSVMSFARSNRAEEFTLVKVSEIARDVQEFMAERLRSANVQLEVQIPVDFSLRCQPTQISQVLVNLIGNAKDALAQTPDPKILMTFEKFPEHTQIRVCDNGPGVSPENREKVLLPFFTTKEPGKGTGLGLSISSTILKAHGGTLQVGKSQELGGAAFVVTIPCDLRA